MPAVKAKWLIENYLNFVKSTILLFGEKLNFSSISYASLDDLMKELVSDEMIDEIKKSISKKTIRENAALKILGDGMKMVSERLQSDPLSQIEKGKILFNIQGMEDHRPTSRLPLLTKMTKEICSSILDILNDLPKWAKNCIKALSEIVETFSTDATLRAITQIKKIEEDKKKPSQINYSNILEPPEPLRKSVHKINKKVELNKDKKLVLQITGRNKK